MSLPEQPFGFVAGRWVRSIGDTPDDADRAPDYVPVETGAVTFTPQITHRVAADGSGWAGIIKEKILAPIGERGQLIDAEGHDHLALAVGIYSVSYSFGPGNSWPSHYIEVKETHTLEAPLWLPPIAPPPEGPMISNRVITIPDGGTDGQVLVWDGAGFSWDYPPEGPQGPKGDLDAEQLAGAPRLTNLLHDMRWVGSTGTIHSQAPRLVKFTAIQPGGFIRWAEFMSDGERYYFTGEVKATSDQVCLGADPVQVYHSGSGDWERLSGTATPSDSLFFRVRDFRSSGWDQVEVRDPVLINLTAVFGAGREPSKEYMDALMEKHGHYIGGVDQFAFGDALQEQTVWGPGLALRHDSSVGERVFLDYPGGSTMIHGDTGWRNVEDLLDPAFVPATSSGRVRVRRVNNQVFWVLRVSPVEPLPMATAQNMVTAIPSQFRQIPAGYGTVGTGLSFPSRTMFGIENRITSEILTIAGAGTGDWSVDESLAASFSYSTTASWPDTLPGEPV